MPVFETTTTVETPGRIHVDGVPFLPGTVVDVLISPRRRSAEEFAAAWQKVCAELRGRPGQPELSDSEIEAEELQARTGR